MSLFWKNNFIAEMLIMEACLCYSFPRRKKSLFRWIAFAIGLLVLSSLVAQNWQWNGDVVVADNIVWNTLWHTLLAALTVVQIICCFKIDLWNATFLMEITVASQVSQFNVYKLLEALLLGEEAQRNPGIPSVALNLAVLAMTCILLYRLFGARKTNRGRLHLDSHNRRVILIATILLMSDNILTSFLRVNDSNMNFGPTMVAAQIYFTMFNMVMVYMLENLVLRQSLEKEQLALQALERQKEAQYHFSQELIDSINIKSHDLKKQINYLRTEQSGREELLTELENITDRFDSNIQTKNGALTAILSEKSLVCSANGIPFTCVADGDGIDFMRDLDIYTLFANLIDNAIEASIALPEDKRSIQLVVRRQFDFFSIHLSNYFDGNLLEQDGELLTLKADRENHGFGSKSIRQIVENYDGTYTYKTEDNTFTVNILIPFPS